MASQLRSLAPSFPDVIDISRPTQPSPPPEAQLPDLTNFSVLCLYDFTAEEPGLLSFKKSDILDIVKRDDTGWWAAMPKGGPGTVVGWIPQAFVTPLTTEMAEKLWNLSEELRIPEFEAEQLYNSIPPYTNPVSFLDTDSAASPTHEEYEEYRAPPKLTIKPSLRSRDMSRRKEEGETSRRDPQRKRKPQPPPSPTSPMPQPPTRSASLNKPIPPPPKSDADLSRIRTGSLNRNLRRRPLLVDDNTTLTRLSTLIDSKNTREIDRFTGPDISASFEIISKRGREGGFSRRKAASEDVKQIQNIVRPTKPRYLKPLYADQIDQDDKGHIRFASLPALVERLTTDPGTTDLAKRAESSAFTNVFLMTFRTFTTADRLFEMLVERFNIKAPKPLTDQEYKEWKQNSREPVRRKVLEVFSRWLEDHRLLEEEPHIAQRMTDFLSTLSPPHDVTANEILKTVERLTFSFPKKATTTATPKKPKKSKPPKSDLLKMEPRDIAEQLTLLEFSLYIKITPQECLSYAKTQTGNQVANLAEFCSTYDKLCAWVKTTILTNEVLGKRAATVDFWVKVAEKCRSLNNFSSMSAITLALGSTVITNLHLTWAHVHRKAGFDSLQKYNEPTGGFSAQRTLLQQADGPCVPFIPMFLTDIIHTQDQFTSDDNRICFYQRARWYEIITNMLKSQSRTYNIQPNESTATFIEGQLREAGAREDNWFWTKSQEVQHSEVAHADIRKGLEAAGF